MQDFTVPPSLASLESLELQCNCLTSVPVNLYCLTALTRLDLRWQEENFQLRRYFQFLYSMPALAVLHLEQSKDSAPGYRHWNADSMLVLADAERIVKTSRTIGAQIHWHG